MEYFPSSEFRRRARAALKTNFPTIVVIAFLAMVPSLLSQVVNMIVFRPIRLSNYRLAIDLINGISNAQAVYGSPEEMALALAEPFVKSVIAAFGINMVLASILAIIIWAVSPVLTLGKLNACLKLLRGEEITYMDVLSRKQLFLRALWLDILVAVKSFLWMLPGMAVMVLSSVLYIMFQKDFFFILMWMGSFLTTFLYIRAVVHYFLAPVCLADDPTLKAREAIRKSLNIQYGRKGQFISLMIVFVLWSMVASLVGSTAAVISGVMGTLADLVLNLVLGLYIAATQCAWYMQYKDSPTYINRKNARAYLEMQQMQQRKEDDDLLN